MASTRATTAALTRLPASLSRAVLRPAAQRSFGSLTGKRTAATAFGGSAKLGMGAWRNRAAVSGFEARRWKSSKPEQEEREKEDAAARPLGEVGFDEVNEIVRLAAPARLHMKEYLSDQSQPLLVDVRSPAEYAAGAIPSALNLPVNSHIDALFATPEDFEDRLGFPKPSQNREFVFYCKAGVRSHAAAQLAKQAGYTNVTEYPGSWLDWEKRGGEVAKGQDLLEEE